jgi:hypothetical protein
MDSATAAGPSFYLLFSDIYHATTGGVPTGLCYTCHESMTLTANDAGNLAGWGYYGFYQGRTLFNSSTHSLLDYGMSWPGEPPNGGASTIFARNPRTSTPTGYPYPVGCLNCHSPHGVKAADSASAYDQWAVPAARQTVAGGNPAVVADYLIPHQLIAWEEALCENCHGPPNVGCPEDIETQINKRIAVGGSGHPVDDTALAGRHWVNETLPVTSKHVECYDCHNPHAVGGLYVGPPGGRLAGMRYIDINGAVQYPAPRGTRQPWIHEVCFKCHGNSYGSVFSGQRYPEDTVYRANSNLVTATISTDGRSNKRFEFDPVSDDAARGPVSPGYNTAFHPVAQYGRNTTVAMCLQLSVNITSPVLNCTSAATARTSLQGLTINCTDCHNSEEYGFGARGVYYPSATNTHRRTTDAGPENDCCEIGPHASVIATPTLTWNGGSDNGDRSLLRDYYYTGYLSTTLKPFNAPASTTEFQNRFRLCFNCHDWNTFYGNNNNTNFYGNNPGNLHSYHLMGTNAFMFWNATYEACMACHYNIHSNVQATNTDYGVGRGSPPPDGDTHLVNFAPGVVTGLTIGTPAWFYDGANMSCNLTCHATSDMPDYDYSCSHSFTSNGVTTNTCADN